MLSHWPYSLLLFPALHLAWEDFRMREVSVLWLAVLGALSVAVGWGVSGLYPMLWRAVVNAGVLAALGDAAVPVVSPQAAPGLFQSGLRCGRCSDDGGRRPAVRTWRLRAFPARGQPRSTGVVGRQAPGDHSPGRIYGADARRVCRM